MTDLVDAMCASRIKMLEETLKDCNDRVNECDETKQALLKQLDDVYEMLDTIDIPPAERARLKNMVTTPIFTHGTNGFDCLNSQRQHPAGYQDLAGYEESGFDEGGTSQEPPICASVQAAELMQRYSPTCAAADAAVQGEPPPPKVCKVTGMPGDAAVLPTAATSVPVVTSPYRMSGVQSSEQQTRSEQKIGVQRSTQSQPSGSKHGTYSSY